MVKKHIHFDLLEKTILEKMVVTPPFKLINSMHNEACFLFTVQGTSILNSPNTTTKMTTNEGVVMKCGNYLQSWVEQSEVELCEAIAVHFHPDVLKLIYDGDVPDFLKQSSTPGEVAVQKIQIEKLLANYVESLQFYFENPSLVDDELIRLKVKELILLLLRTDSSNEIKTIFKNLFNPDQVSFKEVIGTHLYENLTLDDLAVLTNLSVSSFKRKFKEVYDTSPARYIRSKKLEKAADLLLISSDRITDIAYKCGFNDVAHFSNLFYSSFGSSPSEFRAQNKV